MINRSQKGFFRRISFATCFSSFGYSFTSITICRCMHQHHH